MEIRNVLRNGEYFGQWAGPLEGLAELAEVDVSEFSWEPVSITSADVDAERDRRIDGGFEFNGNRFQSRAQDRENMTGAAQLAFMAVVGGAVAGDLQWPGNGEPFHWIAADNSPVPMDALETVELGKAAADWKSRHIYAGRELKNSESIPADFADNRYWP